MECYELNIDGLVGPTHHYAGLSAGNLASTANALQSANPKAAALQGLAKMRLLHEMGLKQAVMPPHERPNLTLLRQCGFTGQDHELLQNTYRSAPELVSTSFSASSMWTANAATITPSMDSADRKMHITTANLVANLHRHQEADFSAALLQAIFHNPDYFVHHSVLPRSSVMGDEGAANHTRLCKQYDQPGVHLYVYGQPGSNTKNYPLPKRYPARQSLLASRCIAQSHTLGEHNTVFAGQNPEVIDQGVFHNDVIAVGNESVLLVHEDAFLHQEKVLQELQEKCSFSLNILTIKREQLSVSEAVATYLFNSQLITLPSDGSMMLIAPSECEHHTKAKKVINDLLADSDNPINEVRYLDLRQSMRNGGGPACLRLRVAASCEELAAMHQGVLLKDALFDRLESWVHAHYRDRLKTEDLLDPDLIMECRTALDELTQILGLGSIYPFQHSGS